MATSSCSDIREKKKQWWLTKRKIAENYVREARCLLATRNHSDIVLAISILDSALVLSPHLDLAMELKARSLIYLRRFKEIADMLQDYIPSVRFDYDDVNDDDDDDDDDDSMSSASISSQLPLSREHTDHSSFKCLSISDLKKKIFAGLLKSRRRSKEGHWRYLVLGQACFHLGLMEDSMLLLLTCKRLSAEAFRRESISWTEDNFSLSVLQTYASNQKPPLPPKTESETISQLLSNVKFLIRRKAAGVAALNAGLYSDAVRHFTKLVEGRRIAPQGFLILVECYVHRASAYKSLGRTAEAIADCNKTLALDPTSIEALTIRASLFETIGLFTESLHDLEQMKLLYNSVTRDGRLPGPGWKPRTVHCREVMGKVCCLTTRIQQLKQSVSLSVGESVDYYELMGLRKGECSRSEIERAQLLLSLRHKPDKAIGFLDKVDFAEEGDVETVRDRAKISSLWLYRLIQKGYTSVIMEVEEEEEEGEKNERNNRSSWCLQQALTTTTTTTQNPESKFESKQKILTISSVLQGGFCRDLISEAAGFNRPYEALSC